MKLQDNSVARMSGSQRLFVHKLRLLRHKTLYSVSISYIMLWLYFVSHRYWMQIGELESTIEKDLKALEEITDHEINTNEKHGQHVRVMGTLLAHICDYMRDMPACKAYMPPIPDAQLDHPSRTMIRPVIKGATCVSLFKQMIACYL